MGWNHIKSFLTKRNFNKDRPHEDNWVTATELGNKWAMYTAVQNLPSDAFGRLRVAGLTTLFDSKQIHDNQPLFWDDQQTSGTGTTSTYNTNQASTTLAVSASTAGKRVRQTFQKFNYQPGKSQLVVLTTKLSTASANGITAEVGQMDDNNGLFFRYKDGVLSVVTRTFTSGSAVENEVTQANWNLDTMDGNGISGVTIDPTKTQILFFDYEWLGVGRVRMGFFIDGAPIYCHEFLNTNNLTTVYMSTPNLPLRYMIENDGTGPVASLDAICASVASEGGENKLGTLRSAFIENYQANNTGNLYGLIGLRLKSGYLGTSILLENFSMINAQNDDFGYFILFNPDISGGFLWADEANSAVQVGGGTGAVNTITNGTLITSGFVKGGNAGGTVTRALENALRLGAAIDGTPDEILLCVETYSTNADIYAALDWRELS